MIPAQKQYGVNKIEYQITHLHTPLKYRNTDDYTIGSSPVNIIFLVNHLFDQFSLILNQGQKWDNKRGIHSDLGYILGSSIKVQFE